MHAPSPYRDLFCNWPETLNRRGIVINQLNDAISFKGFMIKEDLLLLERQTPDAMGGRFVMLQFDSIAAVKLTDPLKSDAFTPLGFEGRLALA